MTVERDLQQLDTVLAGLGAEHYELTLFVSGASVSSERAIRNAQALCETHLPGRYELTIVDVNQTPELTSGSGVLATPTLWKRRPFPTRTVVGSLADGDRVLRSLDVRVAKPNPGVRR